MKMYRPKRSDTAKCHIYTYIIYNIYNYNIYMNTIYICIIYCYNT